MMTLTDIQKEVHETAIDKGWYDQPRSFPELIALCHSELSEALEEFRDGKVGMCVIAGKPEGAAIELADAIIRILDMAEYYNLDMENMVRMKMEFNRTREYRHGGKRA